MPAHQRAAQVIGWIFIVAGVLGFFATGTSLVADLALARRFLGFIPFNMLNNILHLAFGIWGVLAARDWGSARTYGRVTGIIYLALVVLAFLTPTLFGLMPIGSHNIWLHLILGGILAYFGFSAREAPPTRAEGTRGVA